MMMLASCSALLSSSASARSLSLSAKKRSRIDELRDLGSKDQEKTRDWADTIAKRLDSAKFAETETKLLAACNAVERDLDSIDKLMTDFEGSFVTPDGDYRLVWAKSDEAVSEIGTGLHRVPLARLEEIFLTFERRKEVALTEIVRIIGPFPNVKNALFGDFSLKKNDLTISYKRGVDGTGKSLDGKARNVSFEVVHSSDRCLVLVPSNKRGEWLVFEKEPDLVGALERLRVPANDNGDDNNE